jgi:hypothetical protein
MKIVKTENGSFLIRNNEDKNIRRLPNVPTVFDVIDEDNTILVIQPCVVNFTFQASDVIAYQIYPDAEVEFSGGASELLDILTTIFE